MSKLTKSTTLGAAILTALLPLACCWGPTLVAGIAVLSGAATKMAWLHPYEPWLYAVSFSMLGYSHYKSYKEQNTTTDNCNHCAADSPAVPANKYAKTILWLATGLVVAMFILNQFPEWFV